MVLKKLFLLVVILGTLVFLGMSREVVAQTGPGNLSGGLVCNTVVADALLQITRGAVSVSECATNAQQSLEDVGALSLDSSTFENSRCAAAIIGFKAGMARIRELPQLSRFATRIAEIDAEARTSIQTLRQNPTLAGRRGAVARVVRQVPPRTRLIEVSFARRVSRAVNWADHAITARTAVGAVTLSAIVQGFLGGAGECDVENSPIPLVQAENGRCEVNMQATEQLFEMLANPGQTASYAAQNPEFCGHLEQLNAYLLHELYQSFPMLSGDITLGPTCRVAGSDYTYDLATRSSGSQFATNTQYQITRHGSEIRILDSSSGVQQTYTATLDPSDASIIQSLTVSGNGSAAEIDLSINNTNNEQRVLINQIQSIVNLDNAFYGRAVLHCCQPSANNIASCSELGLRPTGTAEEVEEGAVRQ